jgi:hypothetical protein
LSGVAGRGRKPAGFGYLFQFIGGQQPTALAVIRSKLLHRPFAKELGILDQLIDGYNVCSVRLAAKQGLELRRRVASRSWRSPVSSDHSRSKFVS